MRRLHFLRRVPLLASAAIALAACSSGGSTEGAAAGTEPPVASAAAQPSQGNGNTNGVPAGAVAGPSGGVTHASVKTASLGRGADLNGAIPFPADNAWNVDISNAPVDPNSANLIATLGATRGLHADFGAGLYEGAPIGIPYVVVGGTQPKVPIRFTTTWNENDPGPYPVPADAPVEGEIVGSPGSGGDRHVIVIDRDNDRLYELYRAFPNDLGGWDADSGALFHLDSNVVRPGGQPGWTSADAAGLPIFPGLARYDEAARGEIRHALRFTASQTRKAYVPPATHAASSSTDVNRPPMGMRVRLKASYAIPAGASTPVRALLQAMKTYGMILADNGSNWYVTGAPDDRWDNDALQALGQVKGSDFEVIRMDGLVVPASD